MNKPRDEDSQREREREKSKRGMNRDTKKDFRIVLKANFQPHRQQDSSDFFPMFC